MRCRIGESPSDVAAHIAGYDFIKAEDLYTFDGQIGHTLSQGE